MTDVRMALTQLLEKGSDADLLREMVGYVAQAAVRGIRLDDCRIETEGELDLRGFLGLDEKVPPGYRRINYTVWLDGDGSRDQFEEIHQAVMATSPNYFNMAQPVQMCGRLG